MAFFQNHLRVLQHFVAADVPQVFAQGRGIAEFLRLEHEVKAEMVVGGFGVVIAFGKGREGDAVIACGFEVADQAALDVGHDGVKHAAGECAEIGGGQAREQGKLGFPCAAAEGVHAQRRGKAGVGLRRKHGQRRQVFALEIKLVRIERGFLQTDYDVGAGVFRLLFMLFRRPFRFQKLLETIAVAAELGRFEKHAATGHRQVEKHVAAVVGQGIEPHLHRAFVLGVAHHQKQADDAGSGGQAAPEAV